MISGIFHLTLVHNRGIAFGLLRQHESWLLFLISISLAVLGVWAVRSHQVSKTHRWELALILGGAIGNWIDRLRIGSVIDFLDFRIWPVFNVADSAITVGVVLYLWHFFKKGK